MTRRASCSSGCCRCATMSDSLAEEYDPWRDKRMLGNFPQALSHLSLINSARNMMMTDGKIHAPGEAPHELHPAAGGVR